MPPDQRNASGPAALTLEPTRCFASARRAESVRELEAEGLLAVRLDVDDPGSIRAAVDAVLERAGRIDLLVNNAGQSLFGPLAELPLERIDAVYRTDLRGPLAVAQAVVPAMAKQGWSRIANVGNMVGVVPTPWTGAYCAMKAALHKLSEVLRIEVAPLGIEVCVVQPGVVRLGRGTGFLPLLSALPGPLRDRLFARAFGLSGVRASGT